jgi:hypothetical protein
MSNIRNYRFRMFDGTLLRGEATTRQEAMQFARRLGNEGKVWDREQGLIWRTATEEWEKGRKDTSIKSSANMNVDRNARNAKQGRAGLRNPTHSASAFNYDLEKFTLHNGIARSEILVQGRATPERIAATIAFVKGSGKWEGNYAAGEDALWFKHDGPAVMTPAHVPKVHFTLTVTGTDGEPLTRKEFTEMAKALRRRLGLGPNKGRVRNPRATPEETAAYYLTNSTVDNAIGIAEASLRDATAGDEFSGGNNAWYWEEVVRILKAKKAGGSHRKHERSYADSDPDDDEYKFEYDDDFDSLLSRMR